MLTEKALKPDLWGEQMRGCIVKRGAKSWAVVVYLGRDPQTGKERRKWYSHPTRREAERTLHRLVNHLNDGGALPPSTKLLEP
jgi:hypothetical protein